MNSLITENHQLKEELEQIKATSDNLQKFVDIYKHLTAIEIEKTDVANQSVLLDNDEEEETIPPPYHCKLYTLPTEENSKIKGDLLLEFGFGIDNETEEVDYSPKFIHDSIKEKLPEYLHNDIYFSKNQCPALLSQLVDFIVPK